MNNIAYFKEHFDRIQSDDKNADLSAIRQEAFNTLNQIGIPTMRNEEWKYTRISGLFNIEYQLAARYNTPSLTLADIDALRLPGFAGANELVFINGVFSQDFSIIRSNGLTVLSLEEAAGNGYKTIVKKHFNHSGKYLKDGINALNTAFMQGGVFIHVHKKQVIEHPIYIYNITDARQVSVLSQPRGLIYIDEQAQVQLVETYATLGASESFTNQVMEIVVEQDANVAYYKIQNDASHASQVSVTHIRQTGKSYVHAVTISLNGSIVRNNLHAVMEAPYAEVQLYGLYFLRGRSHVDNHTVVDNVAPNCLSNELYKGILDNQSTGVFNGKVFVRKDAQKTNAFQSNRNVLLSDAASINTKPQLEIFADDVKCSHGCTVGSLDEDGLFYLQSRGIPYEAALALLLQGFSMDILEKINLAPIREYVEILIAQRLTLKAFEVSGTNITSH